MQLAEWFCITGDLEDTCITLQNAGPYRNALPICVESHRVSAHFAAFPNRYAEKKNAAPQGCTLLLCFLSIQFEEKTGAAGPSPEIVT